MTKITILSGAGISAESGLGTFRSKDGIWAKYDLRTVATPAAFRGDPQMVLNFYNLRRTACREAQPNAAHLALARLEAEHKGAVTIITQNVDDLHERAGSKSVIHMHGELMRAKCASCDARWEAPMRMEAKDPCPNCKKPTTRPDVVWFGEETYHDDLIGPLLKNSDIFIVIGTSGQVYPAADFAHRAKQNGAKTILINLEPIDEEFDELVIGKASETVPAWVEGYLNEKESKRSLVASSPEGARPTRGLTKC